LSSGWKSERENERASIVCQRNDGDYRRVDSFPTVGPSLAHLVSHGGTHSIVFHLSFVIHGNVARGCGRGGEASARTPTFRCNHPSYLHLLVLDQTLSSQIITENSTRQLQPLPPARLSRPVDSPRPLQVLSTSTHHTRLAASSSARRPHPAMLANAWTHTPEDALAFYGTDAETGLTEEQAKRNRRLYGENSASCLIVFSHHRSASGLLCTCCLI
jgi:hypothetical protein